MHKNLEEQNSHQNIQRNIEVWKNGISTGIPLSGFMSPKIPPYSKLAVIIFVFYQKKIGVTDFPDKETLINPDSM